MIQKMALRHYVLAICVGVGKADEFQGNIFNIVRDKIMVTTFNSKEKKIHARRLSTVLTLRPRGRTATLQPGRCCVILSINNHRG